MAATERRAYSTADLEQRVTEIEIRPMSEADVEPGLELVMKVFAEFVAPDLRPAGVASFAKWADPTAFAERLRGGHRALAAVHGGRIVGVVEWMPPAHVAMLFVDAAMQGEGVGQRLFEAGLRQIRATRQDVKTVGVHASRYAVPFYRRLGFRALAPEQEQDGIRYTPMLLVLEE
ncbi:MAG: GNAT family N-acetyltransferase [Acidobacteriota bacterium]|nr:GNAT family N-acetyltransferase [Acidobacteriota bacterium]